MKKMGLSVVAAAVVATAGYAGTVSTSKESAGRLIGSERLSYADVNISDATGFAVYTPSDIPAGTLKNPIFKFAYANAKNLVPGTNLAVYEVQDGNESNATAGNLRLVANNPVVSGSNSEVLTFTASDASIYVYNNKKYVMRDGNATLEATLQATVVKGSTSDVTLAASLWSGDSQAKADEAAASTIATIGKEFTATVDTKLDARINAANNFYKFYDQGDSDVKDSLIMKVTRNTVIANAGLVNPQVNLVTFSDTNLSANGYSVSAEYNSGTPAATANDYNVTMAAAAAHAASTTPADYKVQYAVNGTSKIEKTTFDAHMWISATGTTSTFDVIAKASGNAGAWTIYGYNAQIPNVMGTDNFQTNLKFTNRSGIDADVYFTLIDQDGTTVQVDSVNDDIASIPAGQTKQYKAAVLIALATEKDANNFDGTKSISVEVSIPTTPSSVYGFASFKNTDLGQFKDLPIYNTSTMTY